jgi:hypothetical protein
MFLVLVIANVLTYEQVVNIPNLGYFNITIIQTYSERPVNFSILTTLNGIIIKFNSSFTNVSSNRCIYVKNITLYNICILVYNNEILIPIYVFYNMNKININVSTLSQQVFIIINPLKFSSNFVNSTENSLSYNSTTSQQLILNNKILIIVLSLISIIIYILIKSVRKSK